MSNRSAKGDSSASIFIRAAYLIGAYINCTIHVQHLPRMSDWGAEVSDRLSRKYSTTLQDRKLLSAFSNRPIPLCLSQWFENPVDNFDLAIKMLNHVKCLI